VLAHDQLLLNSPRVEIYSKGRWLSGALGFFKDI
jgi:hypothetical protein